MAENVILVDVNDNIVGTMEKMEAHVLGKLHRAFSIFIFNTKGELLLQQRAIDKYHSGGMWTNTCCSHPRLGEKLHEAAVRRLKEEMGMDSQLHYGFNFIYKASLTNEISEHEFDHVFFGISDQIPLPDPAEVVAYRYIAMNALAKDITAYPEQYTEWLKICFNRVQEQYNKTLK